MPPHTHDALAEGRVVIISDEQIETFKLWIDHGALNN